MSLLAYIVPSYAKALFSLGPQIEIICGAAHFWLLDWQDEHFRIDSVVPEFSFLGQWFM